jgi:DNA-3-methyladenine glycosylase I
MLYKERCGWCGTDEVYCQYHDFEWGIPCYDDTRLFEFLILEGAQAGLSWITILKRREHYREAFSHFRVDEVAKYTQEDVARLMSNKGIIRNRLKIESTISNAICYQRVQSEFGSFSDYIWGWVDNTPLVNTWSRPEEIPAKTSQSDMISQDMRRRGFRFFGSTICYAFMQAMGLVDDHVTTCFKRSGNASK